MSLSKFVQKADGSQQQFDAAKVIKTCLRLGASRRIAEKVAQEIEEQIHDGIRTRAILQMIYSKLRLYKPEISHLTDLRKALSMISPRAFEVYIQQLLREHGYEVIPNQIVQGKCIAHEIDAIASKDDQMYLVEIKHHVNYHSPTGLDESRIARAVFEDITEGYQAGMNSHQINRAMIVTNTKFSEHSLRYSQCRGIDQIGWSFPTNQGLQDLIEENQFHPLTCLKGLDEDLYSTLISNDIIAMKQIINSSSSELARRTGRSHQAMDKLIHRASLLEKKTRIHERS
jgi:hypothetical protein